MEEPFHHPRLPAVIVYPILWFLSRAKCPVRPPHFVVRELSRGIGKPPRGARAPPMGIPQSPVIFRLGEGGVGPFGVGIGNPPRGMQAPPRFWRPPPMGIDAPPRGARVPPMGFLRSPPAIPARSASQLTTHQSLTQNTALRSSTFHPPPSHLPPVTSALRPLSSVLDHSRLRGLLSLCVLCAPSELLTFPPSAFPPSTRHFRRPPSALRPLSSVVRPRSFPSPWTPLSLCPLCPVRTADLPTFLPSYLTPSTFHPSLPSSAHRPLSSVLDHSRLRGLLSLCVLCAPSELLTFPPSTFPPSHLPTRHFRPPPTVLCRPSSIIPVSVDSSLSVSSVPRPNC
jgi:hypothetical protein